jgi:biopolymer transport protein ExbD
MRSRLEEEDSLTVDMAPLIDCVFLLLIFFLVATTLKKVDHELPLTLPEASAAVPGKTAESAVIVGIDAQGGYYLDGEPASVTALRDRLRDVAQAEPLTPIRVDADQETPYRAIVHVLDLTRFWGLEQVGLNTRRAERTP